MISKKVKNATYYAVYRAALQEKSRLNYESNRSLVLERKKGYRADNRVKLALANRAYKKKNRKKLLEAQKVRRENDVNFRLAGNLRARLGYALRNGSAVRDLGCSISELKLHLESKFQPGMSWDNYGDWHIDHIEALVKFDLTDRDQFLEVCHYTNLQPLWARENLMKGAS